MYYYYSSSSGLLSSKDPDRLEACLKALANLVRKEPGDLKDVSLFLPPQSKTKYFDIFGYFDVFRKLMLGRESKFGAIYWI